MFNRRAVFIDRDGTVIEAVHRPDFHKKITAPFNEDELRFVPNVYSDLQRLKEMKFLRILVTNQPDVAHGYMDEDVWRRIQKRIEHTFGFDDVFMCRHRDEDKCPFKKPSPLMLLSAADKWGIDLGQSYMIGDTEADVLSGKMAGCRTILIDMFYNKDVSPDIRVASFADAVRHIQVEELRDFIS
ncbi:MAG: hypothetical protein A2655_01225 [Candidatus Yanofskybacteria bacterium RIFCSPHIGHO2_01_FULL_43_42]|uniref:D,D-heptose 1,7-bisphosphate phosphatase n=1 Tax=Candidatus Yanofskybacteria bacterium RIFCSPLOWO2_01_FULL_43_22 TaxID=1802695 RepID=A0A1F8GGE5_9BACT|nr:MAG: hypothetical protein A2655_01225 [Candidatus Yanofskybacteria bacterium RIFCSPHIGHO2_01_FULL_43_42]OGN13815.1 MAG: hypothetical protein A3D48_00495 [Candidatus Yanofskybacteria bacterium RIFCSPHIGHO2_02_FULL_43_17]OGN23798.1 MAG: hypothetical protein A3A13_02010 [Candidatus Yanofskybacteria bacterium RIFCSPLOWO2_01_FULL_43_22]